ncbi:MAG: hypothetical protein Pg6C_14630 [Treponemataceae bacterium]|nr:MAG: hypothetical protein Pg6C_14630 [Treponemataceae bacterium]
MVGETSLRAMTNEDAASAEEAYEKAEYYIRCGTNSG